MRRKNEVKEMLGLCHALTHGWYVDHPPLDGIEPEDVVMCNPEAVQHHKSVYTLYKQLTDSSELRRLSDYERGQVRGIYRALNWVLGGECDEPMPVI